MDKKFCKFEHRCNHKKMGIIYCFMEIPQPVERCVLYGLMEDREKAELKALLKAKKLEVIKEPLVKG